MFGSEVAKLGPEMAKLGQEMVKLGPEMAEFASVGMVFTFFLNSFPFSVLVP